MAGVVAEIGDRWRDLGPALWIAAAGIGAMWLALLGLCAALTEPRQVDPGPQTLDLAGPEPPAVANLIASDWRLGAEALPATLLDLAARKHLQIDQVGEQTYVRVPNRSPSQDQPLRDYEDMVLAHVRSMARQNDDGVVPAEALTTGPDADSRGWWRRFRKAVERDARQRGLSRPRWSPGVHTLLVATAAVVAVAVGVGISALPESDDSNGNSSTSTSDDEGNPVMGGIFVGIVAWGGLISMVETVGRRQRDTPAGREAAARWLGFRELLGQDKAFGEQPPAGVAIWDRHIAYGATLGLAHAAVRALPLGAESDTSAWSSVGGRWRVVRIHYPRFRPAYGRHPLLAFCVGLLFAGVGLFVLSKLPHDAHDILDPLRDDATVGEYAARDDVELGGQILLTTVLAGFVFLTAIGAWMLAAGFVDLVTGRDVVEGRVLRYRVRGSDKSLRWYVAVDDGTERHIQAWRFHKVQHATQGTMVRAAVTRHLRHVRDFAVAVTAADSAPELIPDDVSASSD